MVEIIPKQIRKTPLWQDILFYSSLIILILSVVIYFMLGNFLKNSSQTRDLLKNEAERKKTEEEQKLEDMVIGYQRKIEEFSKLIENYQQTSNIFDFLQKFSHPKVWFSKLEVSRGENQLLLGGSTENFEVLGQQFLIFKNNPLIKNISLANISITKDGKIEFNLRLRLDPQLFTPKN